jgi:hypothetical protein
MMVLPISILSVNHRILILPLLVGEGEKVIMLPCKAGGNVGKTSH